MSFVVKCPVKIIFIIIWITGFCTLRGNPPDPWLHDRVPLTNAEVFAPAVISTGGIEFSPSVSEDFKTFYYVISNRDYSRFRIVKRKLTGTGFGPPVTVIKNSNRQFSPFPFKNKLYYAETGTDMESSDLFFKLISDGSFSQPVKLPAPVNTEKMEGYLSVSERSTICFESRRDGGMGDTDIYLAYLQKDGTYRVENAGPAINSRLKESDPYIAPDESYMIVTVYNREDGMGQSDLYVSFKKNGQFSPLKNMGSAVNSRGLEHNPHMSPDGKILFFSSDNTKGGDFDIFWISGKIIHQMKEMPR